VNAEPSKASKWLPSYSSAAGKNAWEKSLRGYPTAPAPAVRTRGSPKAVKNLPGSPQSAKGGLIPARAPFKLA